MNVESSAHSDVINVIFRENKSQRGGSLVLGNSELSISGCKFSRSVSLYGGCIYAEDFSRVNVQDSEFMHSTSLLGGVMYLIMGEANFTSTLFESNSGLDSAKLSNFNSQYASFTGEASTGGVFTTTLGHLTLHNCVAMHNGAQYGKYLSFMMMMM
jgi:hypothetical protein